MRTVAPTGSTPAPNSLSDTVAPSTITLAPDWTIRVGEERPLVDDPVADVEELGRRARDARRPVLVLAHDGDLGRLRGRRPSHGRRLRPHGLQVVPGQRRQAPEAARDPARRRRAREHDEHVGPHGREDARHAGLRALADGHHRDDRRNADDDAERRQEAARLVAHERGDRDGHHVREIHLDLPNSLLSGFMPPSPR